MGAKTHVQLISEALELAGDTSLVSQARLWLASWLRHVALKHDFPGNRKVVTGTVTLGLHTLAVGNGSWGVAEEVGGVVKAAMKDPASPTFRWELDVERDVDDILNPIEWGGDYGRGVPSQVNVAKPSGGALTLGFNVPPDKAYQLALAIHYVPTVDTSLDAAQPFYPNDETMVQALVAKALWHMNDERWIAAEQKMTTMVQGDVLVWSEKHHATENLGLGSAFKTRR